MTLTLAQGLAFALMAGAVAMFVWGRFRYDLVSLAVLFIGVMVGVVPAADAFSGFSSDIVVIIASALVVSAAVARSGVLERLLRPILSRLTSAQSQVTVMVAAVTLLSMVTKNIGALAIMMPIALQTARRTSTSVSYLLMPMAFGSLLGGVVTLVGTSPNIIVSEVRREVLGKPFGMFDYAPVGLVLAVVGVAFLSLGYRLIPQRKATVGLQQAIDVSDFFTEARVPLDWGRVATVSDLHALGGADVRITGILREGQKPSAPLPDAAIERGDTLFLRGEPENLEAFIARAGLKLTRSNRPVSTEEPADEVRIAEAVVGQGSVLVERTATSIDLYRRFGVNLLAVGRGGERLASRLRDIVIQPGDLLVLQGAASSLPGAMRELGCLPLIERDVKLGTEGRGVLPIAILALAMILVGFEVLPVAVAFFGAAVAVLAIGSLSLRDAYHALDGPVLVLVAALIPISEAVRTTGGADLIAASLSQVMHAVPPTLAVAIVMAGAMTVTPFLNNAATVLLLGPIAVGLAQRLSLSPDPFLMAVALGAACDFLTPIGHQCNTLVMGPGGYRFQDYWRLGAPLSAMVLLVGSPMIAWVWPL